MQNEINHPNLQMFNAPDNRSFWRKLKALFTSRTDTLHQSDRMTDMLMDRLTNACAGERIATEAASKFAALVILQDNALRVVKTAMEGTLLDPNGVAVFKGKAGDRDIIQDAYKTVLAAIDAAQASVK